MLEASFLNLSDRSAGDGSVSVYPAWEVREGGGVVTSWFQVRLAFTDGACVELLAVVCDGRVSIEDVRACPALSLVDLTVLADWIEGPLFDRCDRGGAQAENARGTRDGGDGRGDRDDRNDGEDRGDPGGRHAPCASDAPFASDAPDGAGAPHAPDARDAPDAWDAPDAPGTAAGGVGECAGEAFDGRRARPAWPRGIEGRRLVAQEYRAAQEEGVDPVLAVMCATGHSRRRSLRLIAQARDAGYLTPRHARR
ncbi:DUF6214 family protein [Streptomyces rishiriensis]|uniref:DUF6214 family protein n=1 Tax=Streptomyces rishiriensis TaxID=68264 RepID=UPI0037A47D53